MQDTLYSWAQSAFFNSISWLIIGRKMNRPYLGAFVGLIWFFMPNNLLALFVEGNLCKIIVYDISACIHICGM